GSARGDDRAKKAAESAINSPLLEASMEGARGVLISIAGGSDLGLFEIHNAATQVQEAAHEDANIIFGTVIDDNLGDEVRVTVIAAGFDGGPRQLDEAPAPGATAPAGKVGAGQAGAVTPAPKNDPLFGQLPSGGDPFAGQTPPARPRRNNVTIDDDDVDVPSFMKR
ncbi:MAG: cell division protein FtsZ, partial [Gordonia sp. (in: high G+C Gram-positive bacteria)]